MPAKKPEIIVPSTEIISGDYLARQREIQLRKMDLMEEKVRLQYGLPHLHGFKFYKWAGEFFRSKNNVCVLCSANQISKSSTQIRKDLHWAIAQDLWPKLWATQPRQFWYLYPTRDTCQIEFSKKWVPEFLPRGDFKDDPYWGWKEEVFHKRIWAIHFNSGVSLYFKTYNQDVQDLQTGTCHKISLDEEPPEDIMDELFFRLAASDGHLSAVFTPTRGQEYWRAIVEERGEDERFPEAFKRQVSMYDCLVYEDGSPTPWNEKKITWAINMCKSPAEIEKRVFGRFVISSGLKYPNFREVRDVTKGHPLPKTWTYWVGVDVGSGGKNHPGAITIIGVSPDFRKGRIFRHWRGDGIETTAGDMVDKTIEMTKDLPMYRLFYDSACRDFYLIAIDAGLTPEPAEKHHSVGEHIVNVLFKNEMVKMYDYPELKPLRKELKTLKLDTPKRSAKDDSADSYRYSVTLVPWDFAGAVKGDKILDVGKKIKLSRRGQEQQERRDYWDGTDRLRDIDDEINEFNDLLETDYEL